MTMLYCDGFDHYGGNTALMLEGSWAQVGGAGVELGAPPFGARTGAYAFRCGPATVGARYVLPATKTAVLISMGFGVEDLPFSNNVNEIITFSDNANAEIATLWVQSTGAIQLTRGGTVIGETQGPVIVAGNWHFLEMKFDRSGGTFVLRVDDATGAGSPAINASDLSVGANNIAQMSFLNTASQFIINAWMDDLTVRDTAGSVNNAFLGDRRVATLLANQDTTTAGWTPRYYQKIGTGILNVTGTQLNNPTHHAAVGAASSTSLNVGAGDFTIESFVRFEALPSGSSKATIFGKWDETNNQRSYQLFLGSVALNGGALCFQTSTDGTNSTVAQPIIYPWQPELDTYYHIALVRASGELLLFVDGQQLGLPIADSNTYFAGTGPLGIAGQVEAVFGLTPLDNTFLQGWFDETRFTVGFARYTSTFTPTTTAFPRGSGDPQWADVALLCGYDSLIQDESGFARALTPLYNAVQQTVGDGPLVGVWSTIGKANPDDNTFVEAPFLPSGDVLTLSAQPAANDTVTVGTKNGSTAAVYTFKSALTGAFQVLIDSSLAATLQNLYNAINAGPGAGTKYGTSTTANFDVLASQLPAGQMAVSALISGTAGNSIAASVSLTHGGGWATSTLTGGVDIPGPSDFRVQRPPPRTTLISAVQITMRAFKSDAGVGTINSALVGPLGNVTSGPSHALTVSPIYYNDVYEEDPDTSAPISPATLISGAIRLNRTA